MSAHPDVAKLSLEAIAPSCHSLDLQGAGRLAVAAVLLPLSTAHSQQLAAVLRLAAALMDAEKGSQAGDRAQLDDSSLGCAWALAGAAATLLLGAAQAAQAPDLVRAQAAQAITHILLPLMAAEAASVGAADAWDGRRLELVQAASELAAACGCWDIGLALVQAAARADHQSQQHAGSQQAAAVPADLPGGTAAAVAAGLPADLRMRLAAAVIQQALTAAEAPAPNPAHQQQGQQQPAEPGWEVVLCHAATKSLTGVLALLLSPAVRQPPRKGKGKAAPAPAVAARAAARHLLPAVLAAVAQQGGEERARGELQDACKQLLAGPAQARQLGLTLLTLLPPELLAGTVGPLQAAGGDGAATLWPALRGCLHDPDSASRKRATHVLALTVQRLGAGASPAWQPYLKLLGCLEERAPHLVTEGWVEIESLVAPAAKGDGQAADGCQLGWAWLEVLWRRGLQHEHHQVQRAVLASFLSCPWQPRVQQQQAAGLDSDARAPLQLAHVPPAFVLQALLPAAGQAAAWRGDGAAALQQGVAAWVGGYAAALAQHDQRELLLGLLGLLAGSPQTSQQERIVQRPLAQTAAAAVAAAAEAAAATSWHAGHGFERRLELLRHLRQATQGLGSNWGSGGASGAYAASVCGHLLQAAAALAPLAAADPERRRALLEAAAAWLHQLPAPLVLPGGELHGAAAGWLQAAGQQQLLHDLRCCVEGYVAGSGAPGNGAAAVQSAAGAGEWGSWQEAAGSLARLTVLAASTPGGGVGAAAGAVGSGGAGAAPADVAAADVAAALSPWTDALSLLHRRPYLPHGTPERCLLLLGGLLAAAQPPSPSAVPQQPTTEAGGPGGLEGCLISVLAAAGAELAAYAELAAAEALWQPAPQQGGQDRGVGRPSARLAQQALACASGGLSLLLASGQQPAAEAAGRLAACCLHTLQGFAAAEGRQQGPPSCAAGWQAAAARLAPLADCSLALAAAAGSDRGWQRQQLPRWDDVRAAAQAALGAVLALQGAAGAAAVRGGSGGKEATAYCHRLCWRAADGLLELLHCQELALGGDRQQDADQRRRWEEQQAAALAAALRALEAEAGDGGPDADPRRTLLQLRCCRRLLPAALEGPRLRRLLLDQQQGVGAEAADPASGDAGGGDNGCGSREEAEVAALVGWLVRAAWRAYESGAAGSRRRRAGLTAALLAACLHPALFAPRHAALHAPGGPLHELVLGLLGAGAKSLRAMSFVSLQLCGLLAAHPELAPCHAAATQRLLLWGSSEDPGSSPLSEAADAETAAEAAALVAPGDAQLAAALGASELAPRVSALCMLRAWVEAARGGGPDGGGAAAAAAAAGDSWRCLLALARSDPELGAARYTPLSTTHRKKVRLWQALCVLSPAVPEDEVEEGFEAVLRVLETAEVANVRQYADTVALQLLRRRPALLRARVLPLLRDCRSSGSHALSSLILVAARAAALGLARPQAAGAAAEEQQQQQPRRDEQRQKELADSRLLGEVAEAVAPWALSHVHALRTFAQLVLWRLYELLPALPARDATAAALLRFFSANEEVGRLRRGLSHAFYFDAFDLDAAVTPAAILSQDGAVYRCDASFEGAPASLLEEVAAFLAAERQQLRHDLHQVRTAALAREHTLRGPAATSQPPASSAAANWQKKGGGGAWAAALGAAALRSGGEDGLEAELAAAEAAAASRAGPRQELLVVASLLSRAPNLAGLARTCEVFRAGGLVLADLATTRQPEFRSIAVSAHLWLPLLEVPEAGLAGWLRAQAARGWSLVGLEQSAESVPLQAFSFPRRTVLLLGREKEGIPADLLALMHHTVEIPQLGVVRSLNVHVSGALAIHQYTQQALAAAAGGSGAAAAGASSAVAKAQRLG